MAKTAKGTTSRKRGRPSLQSQGKDLFEKASFVQEFRKLGFTEYEAKAYLTLCHASPATAYEVSKIAGLAKANIYSALEGLAQRGAVQPVSDAPVKYVPVEPSKLLRQIAKNTATRCEDLAAKFDRMPVAEGIDYVWMVNDEKSIRLKIGEMIDRAQQHIWIKAGHLLLEEHIAALNRAAKRGVKTVIVLFGGKDCLTRFSFGRNSRVYLHEGSGTIIGPAERLVTLSIDFQEALTATIGEGGHGAFTRNSPVVYMTESFLRHEVYLAEIFHKFGPQIEKTFGPALIKLREKYLPADDARELKKTLSKL